MQQLDDTGYSGHISFVLAPLENPGFFGLYRLGKFNPEAVAEFGQRHPLIIRVVTRSG